MTKQNISATTKLYGFFGFPALHSLSPIMQNAAFIESSINAAYLAFAVSEKDLSQAIKGAQVMGIKGLSVSLPHKVKVMEFCDVLDSASRDVGAVNTLKFEKGKIFGFNTDVYGLSQSIAEKIDIASKNALILGAGGTARTAVVAMKKLKAKKITVLNRTLEKAKTIAVEQGVHYDSLNNFKANPGDVILNTTSVGLTTEDSIITPEKIPRESIVFDSIYKKGKKKTLLLRTAENKGCLTIDGLRMLFFQGIKQFEIWTEKKAPQDKMWQVLEQEA